MPFGTDWKTIYFFGTTSAVLVLSVASMVPFLGQHFAFICHKMALLMAMAAFSFRTLYSATWPKAWSLQGLRDWVATFATTNNFQYTLYAFIFATGRPVAISLLPLVICCGYQWATIASKLYAEHPLWQKFGVSLFERMQAGMMQAMVMCASSEISTAFLLIFELFTRNRNPLRLMLYWNFLRARYHCADNTVLRLKLTYANTTFYHTQVWKMFGDKLAPVLNISFLKPAVTFAKAWFTGAGRAQQN